MGNSIDREKVIKWLEICSELGSWHGLDCRYNEAYKDCPYRGCETGCIVTIAKDAIALLKEQEAIKPTINEYGKAYCICGESVGIIPSSKSLPKVCSKYCPECGRKMKWE